MMQYHPQAGGPHLYKNLSISQWKGQKAAFLCFLLQAPALTSSNDGL